MLAGVIAALCFEIATDSRTFSKAVDVAHTMLVREIAVLQSAGRVTVEQRDARTMRIWIRLT